MRLRVVCGLELTMAIFWPTTRLRSVDFPALGRPRMATKPARALSFFGSILSFGCVKVEGDPLVRCSDAERFHLAIEVAALEAQRRRRLRHIPAIFLQLTQNKFALIGAARFVQSRIWLLRAFRHSTKDFGRQMMRLNACLRANDNQALDQIAKLANVSRPRMPQ